MEWDSICPSVTALFYLVCCPSSSSMLPQMTGFLFFLRRKVYFVEVNFFYIYFVEFFFIVNVCSIVSNAFSAPTETIVCFSSLMLLMWRMTFTDLHTVKHLSLPGRFPPGHGVRSLQCAVEFDFLVFRWGLLHPCSSGMLAYSSLFSWCLRLALVSGSCCPHQTHLEGFCFFIFFARV